MERILIKLPVDKKPENFEETILFLARRLKGFQHAFRGTAGLVLQGLSMNVDDIDIVCDKNTALAGNEILADFILEKVSFKESSRFKSYFGSFRINKILVEIMGEWQIKDGKGNWSEPFNAGKKEAKEISFKGEKIKVTSFETELAVFARMGRWTAYHKIKKQV